MVAGDLGHLDRHVDSVVTRQSSNHRIKRRLVHRTKPEPFLAIDRIGRLGRDARASDRILIAMIVRQVPDRLDPCVPRCAKTQEAP